MNLIVTPTTTKGEVMRMVYTEEELRSVDSAIPQSYANELETAFWHVMDYNGSAFGFLRDLRDVAKSKNLELTILDN